jgi:hypothetical protein
MFEINEKMREKPSAERIDLFNDTGVPCGPK